MKTLALTLVAVATLALAACEDNDKVYVPEDNTVVVTNDADECPRADGQPCR